MMVFTAKCIHWDRTKVAEGVELCNMCPMLILTDYSIKKATFIFVDK